MQTLIQDLRYGARTLMSKPGFTLIAVITLALGIGVNTGVFSVINAVLLRPLQLRDPDRVVIVWERRASSGEANITISAQEFVAWREQSSAFERMALIRGDSFTLTGGGEPETITAWQVSADFFSVLGVQPKLGRVFAPSEDQAGRNNIVVLGQNLWRRRFGSDPDVIGRTITLSDQQFTVVGVMPALDPKPPDLWLPMNLPGEVVKAGAHTSNVMGRLKPGVSIQQAQAEMSHIAQRLERQYPNSNTGHGVFVISLHEQTVGKANRELWVLFSAVGFVLLIACANVGNLSLARAAGRRKEIAIRAALGAGRGRLIRQLLTESLLLAGLGGGAGLLLALWITDLFAKVKAVDIPRLEQVNIDGQVLAATAGFTLFTGILTGLAPAWRNSRPNVSRWLNDGSRTSAGLGRRRMGSLLIVLETAMALVLLIGGGLTLKSFLLLTKVDPGFEPRNVLTMDIGLPGPRYPEPQQQMRFYEQLIEGIKALPGVEAVGATSETPLTAGDNWLPLRIEDRPAPPPGQEPYVAIRNISNDYFRAMKIPLRKGRFFSDADARVALPVIRWYEQQPLPAHFNEPQPAPAIIVNETMARTFWPNEDPLGKRIRIIASPWLTVVGVVGDIRHGSLKAKPNPELYMSHLQEPRGSLTVVARTSGDPLSLTGAAREQVKALDKDQPVTITTMEQLFSDSVAGERFNALLLGVFGTLALGLAMVGVFGVVNYSVSHRAHEIGVRIALGAQARDIFKLVVGHGMKLALAGAGAGLAGAFALTRFMSKSLYEVSPTDSAIFVVVTLLLAFVALAACWIPARRATKVDPMVALRCE
jgi:putative ABC transport system permease protein